MKIRAPLILRKNEVFNPRWDLGIEVVSGHLWLTHLGCSIDTILSKGDKARLSASNGGIIQALDDSEVRVVSSLAPSHGLGRLG